MCQIETSCGKLIAETYDDGIAKGIKIILGDNIISMIDIMEDEFAGRTGMKECRVLVYSNGSSAPTHWITI